MRSDPPLRRHWGSPHDSTSSTSVTALAADATPTRPAEPDCPARSSNPIDLTVPEIRHPLGSLLSPPSISVSRLLHWSTWRITRPPPAEATTDADSVPYLIPRSRNRTGVLGGVAPAILQQCEGPADRRRWDLVPAEGPPPAPRSKAYFGFAGVLVWRAANPSPVSGFPAMPVCGRGCGSWRFLYRSCLGWRAERAALRALRA